MSNIPSAPHVQWTDLYVKMERDPAGFIHECHRQYHERVQATARSIAANRYKIVMLAGPSSSGKTTTAAFLRKYLAQEGVQSAVVSLDDFYLGLGKAPVLPNGEYDYESVHALNVPLLTQCLRGLVENGYCEIPQFDFTASRPKQETIPVHLKPGDLVIFEGIHALNPLILGSLPAKSVAKIYISVEATVYDGAKVMIPPREIRLARRMVRDSIYRNADAKRTLQMWTGVVRGEDTYLTPFKATADYTLNTFHEFEPGILRRWLLPLLQTVHPSDANARLAANMQADYQRFPLLSPKLLPNDCLIHEFIEV